MNNQLQIFNNDKFGELKGIIIDNTYWFLAGQICRCLGIKNTSQVIESIKSDYSSIGIKGIFSKYTLVDTSGGKQRVLIIPEEVLYDLILKSRKKGALEFKYWITHEVVPSLRKHGEYRMETKLFTKDLHENIKQNICDKTENESVKRFAYSNFHALINKSIGLPEKNNRDNLSDEQLEKIAHRENLVSALISEGKNYSEIKEIIKSL